MTQFDWVSFRSCNEFKKMDSVDIFGYLTHCWRLVCHDDVIKWKHLPRYWPFVGSPVAGEFPSQRSVIRSFDVFFDLYLNKWLSKQSWGWWFETPSCPLWRDSNELTLYFGKYLRPSKKCHLGIMPSQFTGHSIIVSKASSGFKRYDDRALVHWPYVRFPAAVQFIHWPEMRHVS